MKLYTKILETFNTNFIGYAALAIIGQSCLGGVAAMAVLVNGTSFWQMFQLGLVVLVCMITNTSILAQMKHKLIFNLIITSIVTSTLLIVLNYLKG